MRSSGACAAPAPAPAPAAAARATHSVVKIDHYGTQHHVEIATQTPPIEQITLDIVVDGSGGGAAGAEAGEEAGGALAVEVFAGRAARWLGRRIEKVPYRTTCNRGDGVSHQEWVFLVS